MGDNTQRQAIGSSLGQTNSGTDTNISSNNLDLVTQGQLQEIINQLTQNNYTLEIRLNKVSLGKTKMPLIK